MLQPRFSFGCKKINLVAPSNFFGRPSEIFCFIFQHFFQHSSPPSFFSLVEPHAPPLESSNAKEALKTQVTEGCTFIPPNIIICSPHSPEEVERESE